MAEHECKCMVDFADRLSEPGVVTRETPGANRANVFLGDEKLTRCLAVLDGRWAINASGTPRGHGMHPCPHLAARYGYAPSVPPDAEPGPPGCEGMCVSLVEDAFRVEWA